jgi:putative tryptophan/tyrosine transport system substrate-binding protein
MKRQQRGMLPRRKAITGVAVFAMLPQLAFGQSRRKTPLVAVLSPFIAGQSRFLDDLRGGLSARNLRDGREIIITSRSSEGRAERLPDLAAELVALGPDVIVTASAPAIQALRQVTRTIPIVMSRVGDAVDQGFVVSLSRPGGNITGASWLAPELSAKRLELLKQAFPHASNVGVLREAAAGFASVAAITTAARQLNIRLQILQVRDSDEFPDAFAAMAAARVDAIEILEGLMLFNHIEPLVGLAAATRLPAIFPTAAFVEAGGLISYGPDFREMDRRAAAFVEKILHGAPASEIPVEQPTQFELVVNMRTARAMNLTVASEILLRANSIID